MHWTSYYDILFSITDFSIVFHIIKVSYLHLYMECMQVNKFHLTIIETMNLTYKGNIYVYQEIQLQGNSLNS